MHTAHTAGPRSLCLYRGRLAVFLGDQDAPGFAFFAWHESPDTFFGGNKSDAVFLPALIAAAPVLLAALSAALPALICHAADCHRDGLVNAARAADEAITAARAAIASAQLPTA